MGSEGSVEEIAEESSVGLVFLVVLVEWGFVGGVFVEGFEFGGVAGALVEELVAFLAEVFVAVGAEVGFGGLLLD